MSNTPTGSSNSYCLNCQLIFPEGYDETIEVFCSSCGQSNRESKLSVVKLLKDGISNILNLDSRLLHTFRDIIYPAKLTRTYIEGRRKYYVNPARLFIFMLIGIISLSLWFAKIDNVSFGGDVIHSRAEKSTMLDQYDKLIDTMSIGNNKPVIDSIRRKLFKNVQKPQNDSIGLDRGIQLFGMNKQIKDFGISSYDAVHLSTNEIFKKYKVTSFWDRQYVHTYIQFSTNPASSFVNIIQNMTWAVLFALILVSLFMKLLYVRGKYYVVEHAVLLLNLHSLLFLLLFIALAINSTLYSINPEYEGNIVEISFGLLMLLGILIQFLALKKYYQQGFMKTIIKQSIVNTIYFIVFLLSVLLVSLISVFLY